MDVASAENTNARGSTGAPPPISGHARRLPLAPSSIGALTRYAGASVAAELQPAMAAALVAFSRQQGATLFMTLYAAFVALLYRYTGVEDIRVATPLIRRQFAGAEQLMGFFNDMIVPPVDVAPEEGFTAFLARVRQACIDLYCRDQSGAGAAEEASAHGNVAFAFEDVDHSAALELPHVAVTELDPPIVASRYEMSLLARRHGQRLTLLLLYQTSLFERGAMTSALGHYQAILESLLREPDCPIADLPIGGPASA
jgi:non-ribosomal peptide synthetase component F